MTSIDKEWIREQLKKKRINQSDLARALGRDKSAISRLLSGRRGLKADEQDMIARVLGLGVEEFSAHRNASNAGFGERGQAPFETEGATGNAAQMGVARDIGDEDLPDHPIWGSMAGTVTVMPGVDLTAPMEFEWSGKLYNE
jgi:transcriptional regulator with XRE-family HTH domain